MVHHIQDFSQPSAKVLEAVCLKYLTQRRFAEVCMFSINPPLIPATVN